MGHGTPVYLSVCGRGLSDDIEHMEPKIPCREAGVTDTSDLKISPSVELLPLWFRLSRKLLESGRKKKQTVKIWSALIYC